jgi:hypothetical protein
MTRRVFYSFHYKPDCWRVSQIRNIGSIEDNKPTSDNDWENITSGNDKDKKIEKWINEQMNGRSCVIILIGENTANRKWINYEIIKGWNDKKGVFGIYTHNIKDADGNQTNQGKNPFDYLTFKESGKKLSTAIKVYNPPYTDSKKVYQHIADNIEVWIEDAIKSRN